MVLITHTLLAPRSSMSRTINLSPSEPFVACYRVTWPNVRIKYSQIFAIHHTITRHLWLLKFLTRRTNLLHNHNPFSCLSQNKFIFMGYSQESFIVLAFTSDILSKSRVSGQCKNIDQDIKSTSGVLEVRRSAGGFKIARSTNTGSKCGRNSQVGWYYFML
jgi:hypothetical protein